MKVIINTSSMIPIYEQIADRIKALIRDGELKENDGLPSVRALSKELRISALTVKKAGRLHGYGSRQRDLCRGRKSRGSPGGTEKGA